jgi:hypothetical protein
MFKYEDEENVCLDDAEFGEVDAPEFYDVIISPQTHPDWFGGLQGRLGDHPMFDTWFPMCQKPKKQGAGG